MFQEFPKPDNKTHRQYAQKTCQGHAFACWSSRYLLLKVNTKGSCIQTSQSIFKPVQIIGKGDYAIAEFRHMYMLCYLSFAAFIWLGFLRAFTIGPRNEGRQTTATLNRKPLPRPHPREMYLVSESFIAGYFGLEAWGSGLGFQGCGFRVGGVPKPSTLNPRTLNPKPYILNSPCLHAPGRRKQQDRGGAEGPKRVV